MVEATAAVITAATTAATTVGIITVTITWVSGADFGVRTGAPGTGRGTGAVGAVIGVLVGAIGVRPLFRIRRWLIRNRACGLKAISPRRLRHPQQSPVRIRTHSSGGTGASVPGSTTPTSQAAQRVGNAWHHSRQPHNEVCLQAAGGRSSDCARWMRHGSQRTDVQRDARQPQELRSVSI